MIRLIRNYSEILIRYAPNIRPNIKSHNCFVVYKQLGIIYRSLFTLNIFVLCQVGLIIYLRVISYRKSSLVQAQMPDWNIQSSQVKITHPPCGKKLRCAFSRKPAAYWSIFLYYRKIHKILSKPCRAYQITTFLSIKLYPF